TVQDARRAKRDWASERKPSTAESIHRAVADAIAAHGMARVNLQDVAAQLGISKSSIYYHVGSVEQVLYEDLMRRYQSFLERFDVILSYPFSAPDRLRLYMREYIRDIV